MTDDPFGPEDPQTWHKASLKSGTNFDAPMYSVTTTTADDMLGELKNLALQEVLPLVAELGHTFSKAYKPVEGANGGGAAPAKTRGNAETPGKVYALPNGQTRECPHGPMEVVTGDYKNKPGKWRAWQCPKPYNAPDKCDPSRIFVN